MSKIFAFFVFALSCAACTHVAPYDRGRLANPTMVPSELEGAAAGHVHAVNEGATGGNGGGAGGGCGCN